MKKLFTIILLSLILQSNRTTAQITLDRQIDSSSYPTLWRFVQISATETKYFFTDTINNTFSLYNMDFTPFITNIPVPNPWGWTNPSANFEACYITRTLFDCDTSNIEFVFTAPQNPRKPFRIIRTDGTILFQRDSSFLVYCTGDCGNGGENIITSIVNTSDGAKMVLTSYTSGNEQNFVYSLCGTVPDEVFDIATISKSYVSAFPNPSSDVLAFQINLPDNIHEYELVILDNNGKEVRREKIISGNRVYSLDVKNFSTGSYVYSLCTKNKSYQTGKFIINK